MEESSEKLQACKIFNGIDSSTNKKLMDESDNVFQGTIMSDNKSTLLCQSSAFDNNPLNVTDLYISNTSLNNRDADNADNTFGFTDLILVILFCLLIFITIIGNTLVILSVITTRRLRTGKKKRLKL